MRALTRSGHQRGGRRLERPGPSCGAGPARDYDATVSQAVAAGATVTFSVGATGSALSYQWRFNGSPISGATGSAYTRTNAQTQDAGSYSVVVSNVAGAATSADAVLTVTQPTPAKIDSITLASDGQIQLHVTGAPGHYAVQISPNLLDWRN